MTKANNKPYGIIYKITNKVNGKVYIGQTIRSFDKRYKGDLLNTHNEHLKNSILKYGIDNFEIIKEYDTAQDQEELNQKEEYYINMFNSMDPSKGYNKKGGGSRGKLSEETKNKLSEIRIGKSNPMYGIHRSHTEETKIKIGKAHKGKYVSEETKIKISESKRGMQHTEETKIKMSISHKGKLKSEETKIKMSKAKSKKVIMLDKKTNVFINNFYGVHEAVRCVFGYTEEIKIKSKVSNICECCRGKRKTAYGFKWMYEEDYNNLINNNIPEAV